MTLRQQLGDISKDEVAELNRVLGGSNCFTKGWNEPAKIIAWDAPALAFLGAVGGAFGVYGKFVKRGNWLWLGAAVIPLCIGIAINKSRQDSDQLQNCYRYLLAKRAASCEFEQN